MRPHMIHHRNGVESVIHGAQQKTGIGVPGGGGQAERLEDGHAGFIRTVRQPDHAISFLEHLITVHHELAAEFVGMVGANPSQARVSGGLTVGQVDLVAGTHAGRHAALIAAQSSNHREQIDIPSVKTELRGGIEAVAVIVDAGSHQSTAKMEQQCRCEGLLEVQTVCIRIDQAGLATPYRRRHEAVVWIVLPVQRPET